MKNIIAIISTLIIIGLMIFSYKNGTAFQGGEAGHIIEDIQTFQQKIKITPLKEKDIEQEKLKALKEKAGNSLKFEVSNNYKSKCSSCHGIDGSGMQNGKKLMGANLIGQTEEELFQKLIDFKTGRKDNLVMKGLLINLSKENLKTFAKEISQFKAKEEALSK
ncbi:hypothetical protein LXN10_13870 [Arcobacter sp. KX21116]|jgi:cytochrome c553|uniref:c-type cytochrome n=1 Tax=Arcobacter iocasae TaxID=2906515 RepID=UPI0035D444C9|tara:strand:- start:7111 stop:7599 length:489 start_codon:yes stop_codon:yes gene_type:complete